MKKPASLQFEESSLAQVSSLSLAYNTPFETCSYRLGYEWMCTDDRLQSNWLNPYRSAYGNEIEMERERGGGETERERDWERYKEKERVRKLTPVYTKTHLIEANIPVCHLTSARAPTRVKKYTIKASQKSKVEHELQHKWIGYNDMNNSERTQAHKIKKQPAEMNT